MYVWYVGCRFLLCFRFLSPFIFLMSMSLILSCLGISYFILNQKRRVTRVHHSPALYVAVVLLGMRRCCAAAAL